MNWNAKHWELAQYSGTGFQLDKHNSVGIMSYRILTTSSYSKEAIITTNDVIVRVYINAKYNLPIHAIMIRYANTEEKVHI